MICRWCGLDKPSVCVNTRDMEERAIANTASCYDALEAAGGGEAGMRYVTLNRDQRQQQRSPDA